jgi:hypothetical protein
VFNRAEQGANLQRLWWSARGGVIARRIDIAAHGHEKGPPKGQQLWSDLVSWVAIANQYLPCC